MEHQFSDQILIDINTLMPLCPATTAWHVNCVSVNGDEQSESTWIPKALALCCTLLVD